MTQLHNTIHSPIHSAVHSTTANAPRPPADWRTDVLLFSARLFPAAIFWQSGQTKLDGWQLSDSAVKEEMIALLKSHMWPKPSKQ